MPRKPPSYRRRSPSSDRAIVTISDSKTHQRKTYALGVYDSPASREAYHQLIAAWESGGRRLPGVKEDRVAQGCATITELCLAYWRDCKDRYEPQSLFTHREAVRLIRKYHGSEPADSFGPNKLRELRKVMVRDRDWSRTYANRQCKRIAQMFKWGGAHEMVPASVYNALRLLEPLRRGQLGARENPPRQPVDFGLVELTIPHLSDTVADMVRVQTLTAMRPCAMVIMRPCDIDRSGDVWVYTPPKHSGEVAKYNPVLLGPRAQGIVARRMFGDCVFATDRGTPYSSGSYRRSITRACERAGLERWTPYQVRHAVLTRLERTHGLIGSSLVAGHASAMTTESTYVHRDREQAMRIVREVG